MEPKTPTTYGLASDAVSPVAAGDVSDAPVAEVPSGDQKAIRKSISDIVIQIATFLLSLWVNKKARG